MPRKKKEIVETTVVKGSHLTVTTHPDGRTELEWDDAALEKDVKDAILAYEANNSVTPKKSKNGRSKKN